MKALYSVFLVEDEPIIRDGIKNLINWDEYGYSFAGEASDGEIAWSKIQKIKPDVLITDIKMPFMDGLALSRLVKESLPETTIIIISGYGDFNYAQEAISIGTAEYMLKPVTKDQLIKTLIKVKKIRDEKYKYSQYIEQYRKEMQSYTTAARRSLFNDIVSGTRSVSELLEKAKELSVNLSADSYNVILFYVMSSDIAEESWSDSLDAVQSELDDSLSGRDDLFIVSMGIDYLALLLKCDEDKIEQTTAQYVEKLRTLCETNLGSRFRWFITVGAPVSRLSKVGECYRETRKLIFRSTQDNKHILNSSDSESDSHDVDFDILAVESESPQNNSLEKYLATGSTDEAEDFLSEYLPSFGDSAIQSLLFRQYIVVHLQIEINRFLSNLGYTHDELAGSAESNKVVQQALSSSAAAKDFLVSALKNAVNMRDKKANSRYNKMLAPSIEYINANYKDSEIGLTDVARRANISSTHFSTVFSQTMGKTFVEYLTMLRMKEACRLLLSTDMPSSEIAFEVGYNDPHYFSFLFKKTVGCSPRDYRTKRQAKGE